MCFFSVYYGGGFDNLTSVTRDVLAGGWAVRDNDVCLTSFDGTVCACCGECYSSVYDIYIYIHI